MSTLLQRTASGTVPANTRSVRVVMTMTRVVGNVNNGYADDLEFSFCAPAPAATTTSITTCTPNPATIGQSVTCTATITEGYSPTPGGTMAFRDNGNPIAGCTSVTVAGNTVQCTTSALTLGSHNITAAYSGNATFAASTSPTFVQTVNAAANGRTTAPAEVPEADTLLLLGGGMSGLGVWLRWQWSKRKR